jgi:glucose-6-phosphate 1-dehydrogenase
MTAQRYDVFGDIFERYFSSAVDEYPGAGLALVHSLLTSTDEVQDRLAEARHAAMEWRNAESVRAGVVSELFVITQCGLMYAANFDDTGHHLHYLATPVALFDPFIDQIEHVSLRPGEAIAVDRRCSHDLSAAHPMDAALRRILDEHAALRVDLPV